MHQTKAHRRCICGCRELATTPGSTCPSCGRTLEDVHAYERAYNTRRAERRGSSLVIRRRERARRIRNSRVVLGLEVMVSSPFVGEVVPGVPWGHAWAGLDPLPTGVTPLRSRCSTPPSTTARSCEVAA
jgi:hypothetical protein